MSIKKAMQATATQTHQKISHPREGGGLEALSMADASAAVRAHVTVQPVHWLPSQASQLHSVRTHVLVLGCCCPGSCNTLSGRMLAWAAPVCRLDGPGRCSSVGMQGKC